MNDKYSCCIDFDRIKQSLDTLISVNDNINSSSLTDVFFEILEEIKRINFEHGNCISSYKYDINNILDKINELKQEVNLLTNSLAKTVDSFSRSDELNENDFKLLSGLYNGFGNENISSLRVSHSIEDFKKNMDESISFKMLADISSESLDNVNTVPIGLGIGAAGVAASVGAVAINAIDQSKNDTLSDTLEEYSDPDEVLDNLDFVDESEEEEITPYHAIRDENKDEDIRS